MVTYQVRTRWWLRRLLPKGLVWDMPAEQEPVVYLTFDDGPNPKATTYVLEQLERYDAKATFFCVGENVTRHPEVYNEVLAKGHATANHTFNHLNGWKTADDVYITNIEKAAGHISSRLFRPPYGRIKRSVARQMMQAEPKWKIVMWSVLSGDFDKSITPEQCAHNVTNNIKPGSIVLFHDSEKAWDRMQYALPIVLEYCKQQNWKLKTLTN